MKRPSKKQCAQLRIALGMTGCMMINDQTAELILTVQSEIERLGGNYSLRDAANVAAKVKQWNKPTSKD